jgi:hypothetical protein
MSLCAENFVKGRLGQKLQTEVWAVELFLSRGSRGEWSRMALFHEEASNDVEYRQLYTPSRRQEVLSAYDINNPWNIGAWNNSG